MSNWGPIVWPKPLPTDPNHKWCVGTEGIGEPTATFERSIRIRLSDISLEDLMHVNEPNKTPAARYLREKLGFTFVWDGDRDFIEAWKDDDCFYAKVDDKFFRFCEQTEEYAAVFMHPSTNLDYDKLPNVNTLNIKLAFHKNIVHRERWAHYHGAKEMSGCTCRPK